ncbi:MAG: sigma 54-interacting transcriptional regulator [Planctomycetota bacterium]
MHGSSRSSFHDAFEVDSADWPKYGELPLAEAIQRFLHHARSELAADRVFLVGVPLPAADDSESKLEVMGALGPAGPIENPDYHLDHHYLREMGSVDGARLLDRADGDIGRPLLSCSFPLGAGLRGVLALEGAVGDAGCFQDDACPRVRSLIREALPFLQLHYRVAVSERGFRQQQARCEELEQELRFREQEVALPRMTGTASDGRPLGEPTTYHGIVTRAPVLLDLFATIERVKDADISVLITGETGTGKELVARAIHYGGRRASHRFEVVACGSVAINLLESELFGHRKGAFSGADSDKQGVFERANGGTVFLDEVADMPVEMQQKILRVLQERVIRPVGGSENIAVDVRIISSTQRDLLDLVQKQQFRDDLYYRLAVLTVPVPALRERREDIPLLLDHFLRERIQEDEVSRRFSESALRELYQYSWPGNVQELRNLVFRAYVASDKKVISRRVVQPLLANQAGSLFYGKDLYQEGDRLHLAIPSRDGFNEIITECERLILLTALRRNSGNKSRVTQQLKIPRQTLYNKLEKHGIVEDDYDSTEQ